MIIKNQLNYKIILKHNVNLPYFSYGATGSHAQQGTLGSDWPWNPTWLVIHYLLLFLLTWKIRFPIINASVSISSLFLCLCRKFSGYIPGNRIALVGHVLYATLLDV